MPSSLRHYRTKPKAMPKSQWKGAGYYYRRDSGTWQKWSRGKDLKRGSKKTVGSGRWLHTNDKKKK